MNAEIISSAHNPTIKHVKKLLGSSKYRQSEALAVGEGIHLARSFSASEQLPELVVCAESALYNNEVSELCREFNTARATVLTVKDSLFESLSDIHAKVGILVVFCSTMEQVVGRLDSDAIILEDVQDPGNLGTMLRTAVAAGIKDVYLSTDSASVWSPKALRAGMGAQFSVRTHEGTELTKLVQMAKIPVLATHLSDSQSLYETDLTNEVAWVFGSEGRGISSKLLAVCSTRITIPQAGSSVESLNVAASAAVCLFEQRRQRLPLG